MNTVQAVNKTRFNTNCKQNAQYELYKTLNKTAAESKIFQFILEEYTKHGGIQNV